MLLVTTLAATFVADRFPYPLELMPWARRALLAVGPAGGVALVLAVDAAGDATFHAGALALPLAAAVLTAWLGSWAVRRAEARQPLRLAVIGSRELAVSLGRELAETGTGGYELIGWVAAADDPLAAVSEDPGGAVECLGDLGTLREVVLAASIDLLILTPADATDGRRARTDRRVVDQCLDLPVRVIEGNLLYERLFGHVPIGMIDADWYMQIMDPDFRGTSRVSKRIVDVAIAALLAPFATPAVVIAALAIKLGDGGPVLYRQGRIGEGGSEFEIVKLRTMGVDAERDGAPRWSGAGDERVTGVGRVLRRLHVDELPQLLNVLRGEMTLVGPRPERPEIVAALERDLPDYTRRRLVKPGVTGWAQVRCGYAGSGIGTAWKLCHDLYYLKHRSLFADLLIMLETVRIGLLDSHRDLRAPDERFLLAPVPPAREATDGATLASGEALAAEAVAGIEPVGERGGEQAVSAAA